MTTISAVRARPRRDNTLLVEGARLGKFRLLRQLGDGGMGKVWLAVHTGLQREVALKVLHRQVHAVDHLRERFEREAVAIGRLGAHPGIVEALDFGELEDGRNVLALEYVDGETLQSILAREGRLDWREAVRIGVEVADALAFAHGLGVVHRDLKPDNLMIEHRSRRARILDLGLARFDDAGLSDPHFAIGTAAYSAPEQLRGEPTDARADVYGLAAVLYRCVTGRPPHPGSSFGDLVPSEDTTIAPLDRVWPDPTRPPQLDAWIVRCLATDPAQRPASVATVRDALATLAGSPSRRSPMRRGLVAAALLSAGAIGGAIVASLLAS